MVVENPSYCGGGERRVGLIASWLRPRNIYQALGWLLACVMVPLLLGATALLVVEWRQERQLAEKQLSTLAQTLVQAVDGELNYGRAQLEVIAASPVIDAQDWQQLHRFAVEVVSQRPGTVIALLGPDGQGLLNTAVPWGQPRPNLWKLGEEQREVLWEGRSLPLSSQTVTKQVFERGQVAYSDLYYGLNTQRPTLSLSVPVIRQGQVRYALTFAFSPTVLEKLIRSAVNAPGLRAALVDRRGIVVATNAAAVSRVGERALQIPIVAGSSAGHYEVKGLDGVPLRGAYAVSATNGFVVRTSVEQPFSTAMGTSAAWVALLLVALLTSVLLASLLGRRMAHPLRELAQRTQIGHPPPPGPPSGIAEIDAMAQALRNGADAERQRQEEHLLRVMAQQKEALVEQSEARLKRVLDQLFVFVAVLDLDGRLLECNGSPLRRAGITLSDVIGTPLWRCHWWTYDDAVAQQVQRAVERATQGDTVRFDARGKFATGELLTVDVQLAPLRDDAGRITNVIASGVEVEDRVAAMRELEVSEARAVESARRFDAEHRMLEATLEAAPVGIAVADPNCQLLQINHAGAELLGIASAANRGLAGQSLRGWQHRPGTHEAVPLLPDEWPLAAGNGPAPRCDGHHRHRACRRRRTATHGADVGRAGARRRGRRDRRRGGAGGHYQTRAGRGRAAPGRPAKGRIPGHPRPRAAQPARAHPHGGRIDPPARSGRRDGAARPSHHRASGVASIAAGGRPPGCVAHHPGQHPAAPGNGGPWYCGRQCGRVGEGQPGSGRADAGATDRSALPHWCAATPPGWSSAS